MWKWFLKMLGFGDQVFQSEKDKIENVERVASELKDCLTESELVQKGDDEVVLRGIFDCRRVEIEISIIFGHFRIGMETGCSRPRTFMNLVTQPGGSRKILGATQAPDAFGNLKVFLTQTIYLEGEKKDLDSWQALLEKLPQEARERLYAQLNSSASTVGFHRNRIDISPEKADVGSRGAAEQIKRMLEFASELAGATEETWV